VQLEDVELLVLKDSLVPQVGLNQFSCGVMRCDSAVIVIGLKCYMSVDVCTVLKHVGLYFSILHSLS